MPDWIFKWLVSFMALFMSSLWWDNKLLAYSCWGGGDVLDFLILLVLHCLMGGCYSIVLPSRSSPNASTFPAEIS